MTLFQYSKHWYVALVVCLIGYTNTSIAQVINGYAEVSGIAGSVLTVTNVDETGGTFEDGDQVIIMQMQDNVIGANTTNAATFGDLSAIASAGLYEKRTISSHTESSGTPTTITISGSITNTYNTGANSKVQIITFPRFGSPNYTTTANMSAKDWDGNTGGVLAFEVEGTLTLAHNLSADDAGFRGGSASINYYSGGTSCDATQYIRTSNHTRSGEKGEGIYNTTNTDHEYERGKVLNGGGGGSERINGGGGGGGNYTTGGIGGPGWNSTSGGCSPIIGGLGGISLSGSIAVNRIFMGGGGGGGQQNNSGSSDGGNGGGIILVKAGTITTSCGSSLSISANGETAGNGTNDGQGGGGAGGTIVLEVTTWSVPGSCPLTISSNAGDGGGAITGGMHAGGGGGGQGAVFYSGTEPTTNITTETNNGNGGLNCSTCTSADGGSGSDGDGIFDNTSGPLPISLLSFSAEPRDNKEVVLEWITETEINNDYFTIEKSEEGTEWVAIATVTGAGNSNDVINYSLVDDAPYPVNYYRIKQTDFNGSYTYSPIVLANIKSLTPNVYVYPNPTKDVLNIQLSNASEGISYKLYDYAGKLVDAQAIQNTSTTINTSHLAKGVYYIKVNERAVRFVKH